MANYWTANDGGKFITLENFYSSKNSRAFKEAIKSNPERAIVKIPIHEALGEFGHKKVSGIRKIGPRSDRNYEELDFSDGSIQAFYYYDKTTDSYILETMFPTQYSVK